MPTMLPSHPVDDCPLSERKVFDALAASLPNDWTVIHARRFVLPAIGAHRAQECEVDFLILNPKRGYIGLEVKGGQQIGRDQQGWYSVDRQGRAHRIKDPGAQAQRATHLVNRYLQHTPDFSNWTPRFGWGVCFPDVTAAGPIDPGLPRNYVIDNVELRNAAANVDRVFDANGLAEGLIPKAKIAAFLTALAPSFQLAPSLASRIDEESPALVQLTSEQMDVLDLFDEFPRVAIKGAAGTGKTLVAMEKARRLALAGKRVLFLCFNRPLAEFLASRADGFVVETFHRFASVLAKRAGIQFQVPKDNDDEFWSESAADLLLQALDAYPDERYDAVVVDEAQDFKPVWWIAVESLLRDKDSGVLYVFYDPNQQIYGGGPAEELGLRSTMLKYNCRNTKKIASYSGKLVGLDPILKPGAPDGENIIIEECNDEGSVVDCVRKLLHEFVHSSNITTERIIILTTHRPELSPVWRAKKLGNITLVGLDKKPNPNEVRFSTLHRFKGLEADIVILCDVRPGQDTSASRHLYVATSRARHLLAIVKYRKVAV